jgi:hypothetical protein
LEYPSTRAGRGGRGRLATLGTRTPIADNAELEAVRRQAGDALRLEEGIEAFVRKKAVGLQEGISEAIICSLLTVTVGYLLVQFIVKVMGEFELRCVRQ